MIPSKKPKYTKLTPTSDLQKLAQRENFAIFQIKSMLGNLKHLNDCKTIPPDRISFLTGYLKGLENFIKYEQDVRKEKRKVKENG